MSLRMGILGLLRYAPMSGYSLKKVFDMSINHIWSATISQIYRELRTLESKGSVVSDIAKQNARPDKRIYSVTPRGRSEFAAWVNRYPLPPRGRRRDEFLLRVFFAAEMSGDLLHRELEDFVRSIEGYRQLIRTDRLSPFSELLSRIGEGDRLGATISDHEALYWRFTVRRFELVAEASVRWAEECIRELEETP